MSGESGAPENDGGEGGPSPPERATARSRLEQRKRRKRKKTQALARPAARHKKHKKPRKLGRKLPRAEGRKHLLFAAGGLVVVLITAALLLVFGFARLGGPGSTAVEINWPAGLDPEQAAALLEENGLVRSASTMAIYLRTTGQTSEFVPGQHVLPRDASPHDLVLMLTRSPNRPTVRIVIPEGFHRFDIATRLHKLHITGEKAFLSASADTALLTELGIVVTPDLKNTDSAFADRTSTPPESAEGYLFPATYDFLADTEAREVVQRLVIESDKRWQELMQTQSQGLAAAKADFGWGRREIVTLASIIQREAMVDDERPIIASVFYNRLRDPNFKPRRRLQSDPTAMYGCVAHPREAPSCAEYSGKPTSAILHDAKNRYSTYMAPGLPPGPISNPGMASLQAALSPASTRFYFFVAKGGGRHSFSETFGAHNDAIRNRESP
ncbi:MAG: endolytic transglycosylase MltG [Polyangiaceae bacterium]|nr:endolytic transglycosylase MltG [Polyangiaceae bacterium]